MPAPSSPVEIVLPLKITCFALCPAALIIETLLTISGLEMLISLVNGLG